MCSIIFPIRFVRGSRMSFGKEAIPIFRDETTLDGTYDGLEFYLRSASYTKGEKRKKIEGLCRAIGVKNALDFVDRMFDQLETFVRIDEEDAAARMRNRQAFAISRAENSTPDSRRSTIG
eukprot:TRINITY_DN4013_c0_g1_i1.p1 TRINITY_DN4013_c0_g1~~TRINITY_DN4013_c0_g1_i1.p1  ORF type:complete len:120 (-),score=19.24 TRINITY_DN4013_c0_g1_i1:119-478(-)